MKNLNPIQQLDYVLKAIKDNDERIDFYDLYRNIDLKIEFGGKGLLEEDILLRILEKLIRDKYVYSKPKEDFGVNYFITVEGFTFIGYEKQLKIDRTSYQRKNVREFALTWGTVLAGIAGMGLLAWQIYTYTPSQPTPINSKTKIEKSK